MTIEVQITSRHHELADEARADIQARFDALGTTFERLSDARITIEAPSNHHRHGGHYEVRADAACPGVDMAIGTASAESLPVAIQKAVSALKGNLTHRLEQLRNRHR